MEIALWSLTLGFAAALVMTAAVGLWYDLNHRPQRTRSLGLTSAEVTHARYMSTFYALMHGAER